MSQTDNDLKVFSDNIIKNLNGMMGIVEKKIESVINNSTAEEKDKLAKELLNQDLKGKFNEIKKSVNDLQN